MNYITTTTATRPMTDAEFAQVIEASAAQQAIPFEDEVAYHRDPGTFMATHPHPRPVVAESGTAWATASAIEEAEMDGTALVKPLGFASRSEAIEAVGLDAQRIAALGGLSTFQAFALSAGAILEEAGLILEPGGFGGLWGIRHHTDEDLEMAIALP